jgi:hypothetical protein
MMRTPRADIVPAPAGLALKALQRALDGFDVLFDGIGYGAGGRRLAVFAGKFAGEIIGQIADALQARDEWGG